MEIKVMPVGLFSTNCYIISQEDQALVIDPGGNAEGIRNYIDDNQLSVQAILLTHAHFDHIGALEELRKAYNVGVYINAAEQAWLGNPQMNGSYKLIGEEIIASPAENLLNEGKLTIGSFTLEVIHTPGHSPGSVSFIFPESQQIFSGDILFNQGIGRTDLPGGDLSVLEKSLKEKLYVLDEHYIINPGHGPSTSIGFEKENNPFFRI
ncbi:MBL fold metallo-hydrolase [Oceanobacillus sp. FSL H7-0719]|uniref:MBL fold metallo-hydrolase n=1 Tax=Oceanobacillus sp. FSL H7-0719 TaxID=2954507 RepID=UPI003249206D